MITTELKAVSDQKLREILTESDPMVLRGLIYHATGDESVRDVTVARVPGIFMDAPWILDQSSLDILRGKAFDVISGYRDGTIQPPGSATREILLKAMSLVVDEPVPESEYQYWFEELAIDPSHRQLKWQKTPDPAVLADFKVVVIGAGLGGITAGVQLKKAGFHFEMLDKNPGVGGTWYQNKYPGARVDLPSRIYSHSFSMNYHFDHLFSPRSENERYVNWCVDSNGLREHIRFNTEVSALRWEEDTGLWEIKLQNADGVDETMHANAIICAVGFLDRPNWPKIEGMDSFQGKIFHTTTFDPSVDLTHKNVAVIGTGASGMQMVPDLLPLVSHMTIFQRSPGWVVPIPGYRDPYSENVLWLNRNVPFYAHWTRLSMAWAIGDHTIYNIWSVDPNWTEPNTLNKDNFAFREKLVTYLNDKIGHRPDLVEKLLPKYPPLSKRYIVDNGWFHALQQENVDLITNDEIVRFTADSIVTKSGREVPTDVAVFATGFKANDYFWPMTVHGRNNVSIDELWAKDGARAFWGVNVAGLPNFFCVYGPNTNPKNTGPVPYGESQVRYILKCLESMVLKGWKSIDVKSDVYEAHNKIVDERNSHSIFLDKRQKSYYTNEFGRSAVASPWSTFEYWNKLRQPDFSEYNIDTGVEVQLKVSAA